MDDVAEQQEIANEISNAISNPVGFGQDVDEVWDDRYIIQWVVTRFSIGQHELKHLSTLYIKDDLLAELEELEQEALDEELIKVGPTIDTLPAVPSQPLNPQKGNTFKLF